VLLQGFIGKNAKIRIFRSVWLHSISLLIEKGADVNAQGGHFGKALQAASYGSHEAITKLLIKKGADIDAQGGQF